MPTKTRAVDEGMRIGRRLLGQLGGVAREARMGAGLSQAELGRTLGVSRAAVARWESGRYVATTVVDLARALRLLGHELRFTTYPVGSPLRDAGHLKLINRVLSHVAAPLRYQTDAPLPNPGDMRAWDILLAVDHLRVAIEVETVLRDLQELVRRISTKRRDGGVDGLILVLGNTQRNRDALPQLLRLLPDYPRIPAAQFFRTLEAGELPPDAIVLI
jgi:transcriptional regulator with XRE-family HTH domain